MEDNLVALDSICEKYFNVTVKGARRKAALGTLPIPAFRLGASRRGPLFVRRDDLDTLIEKRSSESAERHRQMQLAGGTTE